MVLWCCLTVPVDIVMLSIGGGTCVTSRGGSDYHPIPSHPLIHSFSSIIHPHPHTTPTTHHAPTIHIHASSFPPPLPHLWYGPWVMDVVGGSWVSVAVRCHQRIGQERGRERERQRVFSHATKADE